MELLREKEDAEKLTCTSCGHPWSDHEPEHHVVDIPQIGCTHGWGSEDWCECPLPRKE